jgi:hypothetical protein
MNGPPRQSLLLLAGNCVAENLPAALFLWSHTDFQSSRTALLKAARLRQHLANTGMPTMALDTDPGFGNRSAKVGDADSLNTSCQAVPSRLAWPFSFLKARCNRNYSLSRRQRKTVLRRT